MTAGNLKPLILDLPGEGGGGNGDEFVFLAGIMRKLFQKISIATQYKLSEINFALQFIHSKIVFYNQPNNLP